MKSNRQIGLDGSTFISDCLSDGIFFVYSIIFCGLIGAVGDVMKLLSESAASLDPLTNSLILLDLVCSLSMVIVAYYVYFMHCGENMPKLGIKPLLYLEYARLAYYGLLIYETVYRFAYELQHRETFPLAIPIYYVVYAVWLATCVFAAMFILTVLHQNIIRRSYAQSFRWLSLIGLGVNVLLPLVYFITRIWVRGNGDGFYSAGFSDFIRLALAPIFYVAMWFLFMNAIDQVERVFSEVDNAIRDKRYRIEFDEEETDKKPSHKKKAKSSKSRSQREETDAATNESESPLAEDEPTEDVPTEDEPTEDVPTEDVPTEDVSVEDVSFEGAPVGAEEDDVFPAVASDEREVNATVDVRVLPEDDSEEDNEEDSSGKRVKPKKKHRITEVEVSKVKVTEKSAEELENDLWAGDNASENGDSAGEVQ